MAGKKNIVLYTDRTYPSVDEVDRSGVDFNSSWLRNRQDILLKNAREAGWANPLAAYPLETVGLRDMSVGSYPQRISAWSGGRPLGITKFGTDPFPSRYGGIQLGSTRKYLDNGTGLFPADVAVHEVAHSMGLNKPQEVVIQNRGISPVKVSYDPYLDDASEIYSRLQEIRNAAHLDPGRKYTKKDLDAWRQELLDENTYNTDEGKERIKYNPFINDKDIFDRYSDDDILFLLNDVARRDDTVPENIVALGGKIDRNNMAIGLLKRPHRFDGLSEPTGQKQERHDYVVKGQDYSFWQPEEVQSIIDWGVTNPDAFFGEEGRETRDRLISAGMGDQVIGGVWDTVYDNATPAQKALLQTNYGDQFKSSARRQQEMERGVRDAINTKGVATALGTLAVPAAGILGGELGAFALAQPQLFANLTVPLLGGSAVDAGIRAYSPYESFGDAIYNVPTPVNRAIQRWGSPTVQDITKMAYDFANPAWWLGPEKYIQAGQEVARMGNRVMNPTKVSRFARQPDSVLEMLAEDPSYKYWNEANDELYRRRVADAPYRDIENSYQRARIQDRVNAQLASAPETRSAGSDLDVDNIIHSQHVQDLINDLGIDLNDIVVSRPGGLTAQEEAMAEEAAHAEISPEVRAQFERMVGRARGTRETLPEPPEEVANPVTGVGTGLNIHSEPQPEFDWEAFESAFPSESPAVPATPDYSRLSLNDLLARRTGLSGTDLDNLNQAIEQRAQAAYDEYMNHLNSLPLREAVEYADSNPISRDILDNMRSYRRVDSILNDRIWNEFVPGNAQSRNLIDIDLSGLTDSQLNDLIQSTDYHTGTRYIRRALPYGIDDLANYYLSHHSNPISDFGRALSSGDFNLADSIIRSTGLNKRAVINKVLRDSSDTKLRRGLTSYYEAAISGVTDRDVAEGLSKVMAQRYEPASQSVTSRKAYDVSVKDLIEGDSLLADALGRQLNKRFPGAGIDFTDVDTIDKMAKVQKYFRDNGLVGWDTELPLDMGHFYYSSSDAAAVDEQVRKTFLEMPSGTAVTENNTSVDSEPLKISRAARNYGTDPGKLTVEYRLNADGKPVMRERNSMGKSRIRLNNDGTVSLGEPRQMRRMYKDINFDQPLFTPEEVGRLTDIEAMIDKSGLSEADKALAERWLDLVRKNDAEAMARYNRMIDYLDGVSGKTHFRAEPIDRTIDRLSLSTNGLYRSPYTYIYKHNLGGPLLRDYRSGGKIHIKPSHRGKLTELKKRTGKSEAELYNDGNPAHKKMVVFARNARKWRHDDGGPLDKFSGYDPAMILEAIQKIKGQK